MNTKNLTKEDALKTKDELEKRIDFNNKLNAYVRKFRKSHNISSDSFNGYNDEATDDMRDAMKDIIDNNVIEDLSWMSDSMKNRYKGDAGHIFGQVYSCAVNSYLLKDLHDIEKFLSTIDNAVNNVKEENDMFTVERDVSTNRINLYFDSIPDSEVRSVLKSNGFKWSPKFSCWTRQLTKEAEHSLERIKRALNLN